MSQHNPEPTYVRDPNVGVAVSENTFTVLEDRVTVLESSTGGTNAADDRQFVKVFPFTIPTSGAPSNVGTIVVDFGADRWMLAVADPLLYNRDGSLNASTVGSVVNVSLHNLSTGQTVHDNPSAAASYVASFNASAVQAGANTFTTADHPFLSWPSGTYFIYNEDGDPSSPVNLELHLIGFVAKSA